MVKVYYKWSDDFNFRINYSDRVISFNKSNNRTQEIEDWDLVYKIVRDSVKWQHCRIEWDPKCVEQWSHIQPGISVLWDTNMKEGDAVVTIEKNWNVIDSIPDGDLLDDVIGDSVPWVSNSDDDQLDNIMSKIKEGGDLSKEKSVIIAEPETDIAVWDNLSP